MTKNAIRKKYHKQKNEWGYIIPIRPAGSYMRESRVKKIFKKWLKENLHLFNHKPYARNSVGNEYYFEGITKHVSLVLNHTLPEAMLFHHESCCNHDVIAYVGWEKHDKKRGYYDADRVDENGNMYPEGSDVFVYYPTQEELYINEVFEHIIPFVNELFVEGNQVYVEKGDCYVTSKIAPIAEYDKIKEHFGNTSFCIGMACGADGHEKREKVLHVYDLFEEEA